MADEERKKVQPKRHVSKAPPPITPLRGASPRPIAPKPIRVPNRLPPSLPGFMAPQADAIICDAAVTFGDQTQISQFCRQVVSELTPHFSAAMKDKRLQASLVRVIVSDLLRYLLVLNCNYEREGGHLEGECWNSDEWRGLARELARASSEAEPGTVIAPQQAAVKPRPRPPGSALQVAAIHSPPPPARPLQRPRPEWPALFPVELRLTASRVITEGLGRFQDSGKILEFCKHVVSGLAPRAYQVVEENLVDAHFAQMSLQDLLCSWIHGNCCSAERMSQGENEVLNCAEWLEFTRQLEALGLKSQTCLHQSFTKFLRCIGEFAQQEKLVALRAGPEKSVPWMRGGAPPTLNEFKTSIGREALKEVWGLADPKTKGKSEIQKILAGHWEGSFPEDDAAIIANAIWSCVLLHGDTVSREGSALPAGPPSGAPPVQSTTEPRMSPEEEIWRKITHDLVGRMSRQANDEMDEKYKSLQDQLRRNPLYAFPLGVARLQGERTKESACRLSQIYSKVWALQKEIRTASFVRVVFARDILPTIENGMTKVKTLLHDAARRHVAIRDHAGEDEIAIRGEDTIQDLSKFMERCQNEMEIEALELELTLGRLSDARHPSAARAALDQRFDNAFRRQASDSEKLEILDEKRRLVAIESENDPPDEAVRSCRRLYSDARTTEERKAVLADFQRMYPREAAESHWYQQRLAHHESLKPAIEGDRDIDAGGHDARGRQAQQPQPKDSSFAELQATGTPELRGAGPRLSSWDALEISFTSDDRVQLRIGIHLDTRNSTELGFEDRRNRRPNRAWAMLRELARAGGTIPAAVGHEAWPKVEKRMQEIRKAFRKHFGIAGDPVPFVKGTGYLASFKIGCSPSFDT
ncbi:MAG TPA: hypothetical protein VG860_00675 [Terriglobia bacterium]|nr:hypothetical protein [Terriglobia bacterium]